MYELKGKYATATVYANSIEDNVKSQIANLCNNLVAKNSNIIIMPDCHAGKGCVIGTTMTIKDKVIPNIVGTDIGCGIAVTKIKKTNLDFDKLDSVVRNFVPHGFNVHTHKKFSFALLHSLKKPLSEKDYNYICCSIGTLGGGNHFIELNKDSKENIYLCVHTGSRFLGTLYAKHYQKLAYDKLTDHSKEKQNIINSLKATNRENEIEAALKSFRPNIEFDMAYLTDEDFENYIHDMKIIQSFADTNRSAIIDILVEKMNWEIEDQFSTIHNYIDTDNMILRKGSISAQKNEKVIIPINMRDGSILATGKGNSEWNYSAPHGAGRIYSRSAAKKSLSLEEFTESMKGIYSTCINSSTLDESPMAYKPIESILPIIVDTVDMIEVIKPIYNFKAN